MNKKKIILIADGLLFITLIFGFSTLYSQKIANDYNTEITLLANDIVSFNSEVNLIGVQNTNDLKTALSNYQSLKEKNDFAKRLNDINYKLKYAKVVKKSVEMLGIDTTTANIENILKDSDKLLMHIQKSDSIDSEILIMQGSVNTIGQIETKMKEFIERNDKIKNDILAISVDKRLQEPLNYYVKALIFRGKYLEEIRQANISEYNYKIAVEQFGYYVNLVKMYNAIGYSDMFLEALDKANYYKEECKKYKDLWEIHEVEAYKAFTNYIIMMKIEIPKAEKSEKEEV